jgi:hypothetical protein
MGSTFTPFVQQAFPDASLVQNGLVTTGAQSFAGDKTFTGATHLTGGGRGVLPLGAVIATFPHLSGAYITAATTTPDANGFVLCQGQTLASGPMIGAVVPNINNNAFLRGNSTSSNTINGTATRTLSSDNIPTLTSTGTVTNAGTTVATNTGAESSHTHGAGGYTYPGSSVTGSIGGSDGTHTHGDNGHTHQYNNESSSYSLGGATATGGAAAGIGQTTTTGYASINTTGSGHGHGFSLAASSAGITGTSAAGSSHLHTIPSLTVNSGQTVSATYTNASPWSFGIEPPYINAVYLMRVN